MLTKDAHASNPGVWCGLNKPEMTEQEADTVIFGIPFDEAVSYRGGAGEAPKVLREHLHPFSLHGKLRILRDTECP